MSSHVNSQVDSAASTDKLEQGHNSLLIRKLAVGAAGMALAVAAWSNGIESGNSDGNNEVAATATPTGESQLGSALDDVMADGGSALVQEVQIPAALTAALAESKLATQTSSSKKANTAPQDTPILAQPGTVANSAPEIQPIEQPEAGTPDRNMATSQLQELSITPGWSAELEAQNAPEIQKARETLNGYAEEIKKGSTISINVLYGWDYEISKATGENAGYERPVSNAIIIYENNKAFLGILEPVLRNNPETGKPEFAGEYNTSLVGNGAEYSIVGEKKLRDQEMDMPYYAGQMLLSVYKTDGTQDWQAGSLLGAAGNFRTRVSHSTK